jgi:hypothetical protein
MPVRTVAKGSAKPTASWKTFFAALVDFYLAHGHCDVPGRAARLKPLREWVARQRQELPAGKLSSERRHRLAAIGLTVESVNRPAGERLWERHFAELKTFHVRNGHFCIPRQGADFQRLRTWVKTQRGEYHAGKLPAHRAQRLEAIGFRWRMRAKQIAWTPDDAKSWKPMFAALRAFQQAHGHFKVPASKHESGNPELKAWIIRQRRLQQLRRLPLKLEQRLARIGFPWEPRGRNLEELWAGRFAELAACHRQFGHCNPQAAPLNNRRLAHWIYNQRTSRKRGKLSPERIAQLDALGFCWDDVQRTNEIWNIRFDELAAYQKMNGHCRVPRIWPENQRLANWVATQRIVRKSENLSRGRMAQLTALGFCWNTLQRAAEKWEAQLAELAAYRRQFGHCRVPAFCPENRRLGNWVAAQRNLRKNGKLSTKQIARLDALEFIWDPWLETDQSWEAHLAELADYRKLYGHCRVPARCLENPVLANWVQFQRFSRKRGKLSAKRLDRLNALGFVWEPRNDPSMEWDHRFAQLVAFRRRFGHCQVPYPWPRLPALGVWVKSLREQQQAGTLSPEHRARLDEIHFIWTSGWEILGQDWQRHQKSTLRTFYERPKPMLAA